jgi:hypothetical protein
MAAFGLWRADRNCAVYMYARGAMITELALYRLMFQPPPVGGPGGLAREWLDSAYAQAASNRPVRRNCARNGPNFRPCHAVCNRRRQDGKAVRVSTVAGTDSCSDVAKHFTNNASG